MSVPMLPVDVGYGVSAAFNGISIFVTAFPMVSLLIHYRQIKSNDNNKKTVETSNNINDNKSFSYGEYTFTDNLRTMRDSTIVCLCSLFLRSIISFILDMGRAVNWNVSVLIGLTAIQSVLYFVAKTCIYYIFILRIFYSFKGNKFAVSHTTVFILLSIFVAMTVAFLAMMMVLIFSTNILLFGLVAAFACVCDTILSISIVLLFLQRLKMIANDFGYSYGDDTEKEVDAMIGDEKGDELKYIDIITRYALISFLAIFSCMMWEYFMVSDLLSIGLNSSLNTPDKISLIKLIQWTMLPIDAVLNVWCIYFNNAFSTNLYYRVCGKCHMSCKKCLT